MKRSNVIWYILAAIVLIALGFVAGYALNGGFTHMAGGPDGAMPFVRGLRGAPVPGVMSGGLRGGLRLGFGLLMALWCLGPFCGIAALFIVLTRKPIAAPAAAATVAPAAPVVEAAPAETAEPAPKASRKK